VSQADKPVDEAIGRPAEWGEGRYEAPLQPPSRGVAPPDAGNNAPPDIESTPVTRKDYESLEPPPHKDKGHE
jgi:hypothetical protein